jgi:adenylate cyclase
MANNRFLAFAPQVLLSGLFTAMFMYFFMQKDFLSMVFGFMVGLQAHVLVLVYETFLRPRLARRNFFLATLTSTFVYLIIIIWSVFFSLLIINAFKFTLVVNHFRQILFSVYILYGITFGFALSFLFSLYSMLETLLGRHFLIRLLTGKYHKPFEEERIIMFLDLKSSTSIAEKIGHKLFLSFLNDFMYDISQPVLKSKGEIYKYVGDGAIITWKMKYAQKKANPVVCFFQIRELLDKNKNNYISKFGVVPTIKAGVHGGFVVTGEMGHIRKEIAYMGDVINTTSRIESMCNSLNVDFLISDEILTQFSYLENYETVDLGEHILKGKENPVKLSTVRSAQ